MKSPSVLLIIMTATVCGLSYMPSSRAEAIVDDANEGVQGSPLRLVRTRPSDAENADDQDRELRATRVYHYGDDDDSSSKGSSSKGTGSKGSSTGTGSKGSSSKGTGSKGSSSSGGNGKKCGNECGEKDFAYIHLEGDTFITEVIPIDTNNPQKEGSTLFTDEMGYHGFAEYFDHGDKDTHKNKINATITGSCTIVRASGPRNVSSVRVDTCLATCTFCVKYEGQCCAYDYDYPDYAYEGWRDLKKGYDDYKYDCDVFGGVATFKGEIEFDIELDENDEAIDPIEIVQLVGFGPIGGCAGDLAPCANGGLAFVDYDREVDEDYKVSLKVPYNDEASCKLQEFAAEHFA